MTKSMLRVLEVPLVYRLWQGPQVEAKLRVIREHVDFAKIRRVLDVGCGPGTNAPSFAGLDYTGIDINPQYVRYASQRYAGRFVCADATRYTVPPDERFDFVLLNSFLHHVPSDDVRRMLRQLRGVMTEDGRIHIIDLVLPPERSVPRLLARMDRGDFARPLDEWRRIFEESYDSVVFQPFSVPRRGPRLWELVYFQGRPR